MTVKSVKSALALEIVFYLFKNGTKSTKIQIVYTEYSWDCGRGA